MVCNPADHDCLYWLVFRRIKESPVKNLFFLTQLMSFLLASFPLHRHRKSNSRWRRPLAHLPHLFLFAWTFSATFCGPWASLIDLVRISKISHDCTLTPTSKFERRYGKSNDNFAFTNLRVVASHVQKAVYSGELFAAFAAVCACSMLTVIVPLLEKIDSSAVSPEVL